MLAVARFTVVAAVLAVGLSRPGAAQLGPPADTTFTSVWEFEREVRWVHEGRDARFVTPAELRDVLYVAESAPLAGALRFTGSLHFPPGRGRRVDAVVPSPDAGGEFTVEPRPIDARWTWSGRDSTRVRRSAYFDGSILSLPEGFVREMAAPRSVSGELGSRWSDTVAWSAERLDARQEELGRIHRTLVGDTVVDGRRASIVRDSAWIEYRERFVEDVATLAGDAVVERVASGWRTGLRVLDPERGLTLVLADTADLRGEAVRTLPDGRRVVTPARFLSIRRARLHGPEGWVARVNERRRNDVRGSGLRLPRTPLEERLDAGDPVLADSLVAVWDTAGGRQRYDLGWLLRTWGSRSSPGIEARMERLRREAGDTVPDVVGWTRDFPDGGLDVDLLERFLPYLEAPGRLWAMDVNADHVWSGLRQGLMRAPAGSAACTPDACARLEALAEASTGEPRLQELGWLVRMLRDPARWADTIEARVASGSAFLGPPAELVRGIATTWPAGARVPLPEPGADWRAWSEWMNGRRPDYPQVGPPPAVVRFDDGHEGALRYVELRTGRDVEAEICTAYRTAASDSARLVFGGILVGLDAGVFPPDSVVSFFRSGSEALRYLGGLAISHVFGRDRGADDPLGPEALQLADSVVAQVAAGAPVWPYDGSEEDGPNLADVLRPPGGLPLFVAGENLSEEARARWRDVGILMTDEVWGALPDRDARARVRVDGVRRRGPFVMLSVGFVARSAVAPDEPPFGWAAGVNLVLAEVDGRWEVLSAGRWIT